MKRVHFFAGIVAVLVLSLAAWAGEKVHMTAGSITPGAMGEVQTGHDQNGNTEVVLKVEHLAQPDKLSPARHTYVVWIQPRGQQPQNMGQMKVGEHETGEFRTHTTFNTFDVFVTAEDNPTAPTPSGQEVLRATVPQS